MQTPTRAFQALYQLAVAAAGLRDPNTLAGLVVDRARDLLEADAAALYWWFPEQGLLRTVAHNDPQMKVPEPPFAPGEGAAGRAFESAQPVRVDDYASWFGALESAVEREIRSGLAVPLIVGHRAVGALGIFNHRVRAWHDDDENLLMLMAAQVAPAMEAARLTDETNAQAHNFRALHEVAIAAGGLRDLAELGRLVVDRARQLLQTDSATLRWWDATTNSLRLLAVSDPRPASVGERIGVGQGTLGQAFERREPVPVENYNTADQTLKWAVASGVRSALGVPVMAREQPLGALGVASYTERHYTRDEIQLLTLLAAQVGPALEAARLYTESERRRTEAESLAELVRRGAIEPDVDRVIAMIAEQACRLVGSDYAAVALAGDDGEIALRGVHGGRARAEAPATIGPLGNHASRVLMEERTVVLSDIGGDPANPFHLAEGGLAAIGVPLREGEKTVGALLLGWRQSNQPSPEQVRLAEAVGGYASTILDNTRTHERERRLGTEAAARSSELAAVIDNIPAGVYVADPEGRVTLINRAALEILRAPGGQFDASSGTGEFTIIDPATRSPVPQAELSLTRALRGEIVSQGESIVRREGTPDIWLETSAVPLTGAAGEISGALVVFSDVTRERNLVRELGASEERFRSLYGMVACGVLVQDPEGKVIDANGPAQEILGWSLEAMRGKRTGTLWQAVTEEGRPVPLLERPTMRSLRTGHEQHREVMGIYRSDGELRWLQIDTIPVLHTDGSAIQVVSSFIDITGRKLAEDGLAESERKLRTIFDQAPIGLARVDLAGGIQEANQTLRGMLGYSDTDIVGLAFDTVLQEADGAAFDIVKQFATGDRDHYQAELPVRRRDGSRMWGSFTASLVRDDSGDPIYLIGMLEDITARRAQTEQLEYQALHDSLTDLPNRTLLNDRLHQAILTAQREGRQVALLIMDLNRFKDVNDTFGHHLGDSLLKQVGPRIMAQLRESDTVARLGGDEFAVVLPTADDESGALLAARRILKALEEPFEIEDQRLEVGGSIGIAITPQHGLDPATLMRRADIAMYHAKRTRSGYAIYDSANDQHSAARLTLMGELRDAIQGGELVLHFQPQVDLRTNELAGVEGLVRWKHPQHGLMPPDHFLALGEETGLIVELSKWAVGAALGQARTWTGRGKAVPVAVNLSAQNLADPNLPVIIGTILEVTASPASALKLEVTETALMADPAVSAENLARLREMGVRISVDDFGTGYSSLAYLKQLPVDELKIDRSFVIGLQRGTEGMAIVRSAIDLGHSLNLIVVAEGVETKEAWEILSELGCDLAQGYLLTRPLPARQLARWIAAGGWRRPSS